MCVESMEIAVDKKCCYRTVKGENMLNDDVDAVIVSFIASYILVVVVLSVF